MSQRDNTRCIAGFRGAEVQSGARLLIPVSADEYSRLTRDSAMLDVIAAFAEKNSYIDMTLVKTLLAARGQQAEEEA